MITRTSVYKGARHSKPSNDTLARSIYRPLLAWLGDHISPLFVALPHPIQLHGSSPGRKRPLTTLDLA